MNRMFRVLNIRLRGRWKLLKHIHTSILIDLMLEAIDSFEHDSFCPYDFEEAMNKAQLNYYNKLKKSHGI